jgi:hypothetical protein
MTKLRKHQSRSYEREDDQPVVITPAEYGGLQAAYEHFNRELFAGALIDVFITLQTLRRRPRRAEPAGAVVSLQPAE